VFGTQLPPFLTKQITHAAAYYRMKLLYVFPHPDDESFGPAAAMHAQLRAGHEVYLLTLTRGGATKQRHRLGLSVDEMGAVRHDEMRAVEKTLGLSGMTVLDLPDSGLKHMDPREIERTVADHVQTIRPDVLVSYPVHGISGFHDHLVMHAVIKSAYLNLKDQGADYLRRLAFFTVLYQGDGTFKKGKDFILKQSLEEEVDCSVPINDEDTEAMKRALACYETYQDVIEDVGVANMFREVVHFEIYGESFDPPLTDLTERFNS
jgi:LmbE family N-acetylglucosaminyl deacetylase